MKDAERTALQAHLTAVLKSARELRDHSRVLIERTRLLTRAAVGFASLHGPRASKTPLRQAPEGNRS